MANGNGNSESQDPKDATGAVKPGEGGRIFTQEELNAIIADRLRRAEATYTEKFADYEGLKAKAAKLAEYEQAQMNELEKAQARITEAQTRVSELEFERDAALQEAQDRFIQAAFVAAASELGAAHPQDAFALADLSGVSISDAGQVEGAREAVQALVDGSRLVLSGKPKAPGLDAGAGGGEPPKGKPVQLTSDELTIARKLGLTPEQYAKGKKV